jgi:hypothetical protein
MHTLSASWRLTQQCWWFLYSTTSLRIAPRQPRVISGRKMSSHRLARSKEAFQLLRRSIVLDNTKTKHNLSRSFASFRGVHRSAFKESFLIVVRQVLDSVSRSIDEADAMMAVFSKVVNISVDFLVNDATNDAATNVVRETVALGARRRLEMYTRCRTVFDRAYEAELNTKFAVEEARAAGRSDRASWIAVDSDEFWETVGLGGAAAKCNSTGRLVVHDGVVMTGRSGLIGVPNNPEVGNKCTVCQSVDSCVSCKCKSSSHCSRCELRGLTRHVSCAGVLKRASAAAKELNELGGIALVLRNCVVIPLPMASLSYTLLRCGLLLNVSDDALEMLATHTDLVLELLKK